MWGCHGSVLGSCVCTFPLVYSVCWDPFMDSETIHFKPTFIVTILYAFLKRGLSWRWKFLVLSIGKNNDSPSYLMTGLRRRQEAGVVASFPGPRAEYRCGPPHLNCGKNFSIWQQRSSELPWGLSRANESAQALSPRNQPHRVPHSIISAWPALGLIVAIFFLLVNPYSCPLSSWLLPPGYICLYTSALYCV